MNKCKKLILSFCCYAFLGPNSEILPISEKLVGPIYIGSVAISTVSLGELFYRLVGRDKADIRPPYYLMGTFAGMLISILPAILAASSTPGAKFRKKFLEYDAKVKVNYLLSEEFLYQMPSAEQVRTTTKQLYADSEFPLVEAHIELKNIIKAFTILGKYFQNFKKDVNNVNAEIRSFEVYIKRITQRANKRIKEITKSEANQDKYNDEYSKQLNLYKLQKGERSKEASLEQ